MGLRPYERVGGGGEWGRAGDWSNVNAPLKKNRFKLNFYLLNY